MSGGARLWLRGRTLRVWALPLALIACPGGQPPPDPPPPTKDGVCAVECPCAPIPPDCAYRDEDGTFYIHTWPCEGSGEEPAEQGDPAAPEARAGDVPGDVTPPPGPAVDDLLPPLP